MKKDNLHGRRIAALVADGFEKVELTIPKKSLQSAGAKVDIVSLRHGSIRGVNLHEPASRMPVTKTIRKRTPPTTTDCSFPEVSSIPISCGSQPRRAILCGHLMRQASRLRACATVHGCWLLPGSWQDAH